MRRFAGIAAILVVFLLLPVGQASAQGARLPWGQSSDMIAWQTLAQIMAPAGNPAAHNVEFETWASDQDIYQTSPHWPVPGTPKRLQESLFGSGHNLSGPYPLTISAGGCAPPADGPAGQFPPNACIGEEVRRNFASFQYIVSNGLYSYAGLAQAFRSKLKVDMPADAVEFKGDWVKVSDLIAWLRRSEGITLDAAAVRKNYYVNTVSDGTKTAEYALVSFHFSTKQIKDWVWADFEHRLNPGRCDDIGCHDSFGAVDADVPSRRTANQNYGECRKTVKLLALLSNGGIAPVWQNYCLKGSQVTFVQPDGKPTILGDSVIERMDALTPVTQSSCTTCHAYAAFDKNGNHGLINFVARAHPVGDVDRSQLRGYTQNDFVWGIAKMPPR